LKKKLEELEELMNKLEMPGVKKHLEEAGFSYEKISNDEKCIAIGLYIHGWLDHAESLKKP